MIRQLRIDEQVVVRAGPPEPHCRTPHYLRGKVGLIDELVGTFADPCKLAFHKPGLPRLRLYRVRFRQRDLWPAYGDVNDWLYADIYETWLTPLSPDAALELRRDFADA